jgi:UDP-3-O-[3-hydroxymyristoyl] glucosamine N-acyltransferase
LQGEFNLGDLAVRFGLGLRGEPSLRISHVATLSHAGSGALSFLANPRYRKQMEATRATAVLVGPNDAAHCPVAALVDPNPYLAYARIAELLHPPVPASAGIHPTAVVSPEARIAPSASVGPLAVIEAGAHIGERVAVGAGCVVQRGASIGEDSRLMPRVSVYDGVRIGKRCIVHSGAVLGADGFGFAPDGGTWVKVPQLGSVQIGDDVEIGANTTIDRGAIEDTVVEEGVKLDNQIQVGHNVTIGAHSAVAGCVGISGSTTIGRRCMIGGGVGLAGHLTIADDVVLTGFTLVTASIKEPGSYSSGMPAVESRTWRRIVAHLRRMNKKEQ